MPSVTIPGCSHRQGRTSTSDTADVSPSMSSMTKKSTQKISRRGINANASGITAHTGTDNGYNGVRCLIR